MQQKDENSSLDKELQNAIQTDNFEEVKRICQENIKLIFICHNRVSSLLLAILHKKWEMFIFMIQQLEWDKLDVKEKEEVRACLTTLSEYNQLNPIKEIVKKMGVITRGEIGYIAGENDTGLHFAVKHNNIEMLKILSSVLVPTTFTYRNSRQETPFDLALEEKSWEMVYILLTALNSCVQDNNKYQQVLDSILTAVFADKTGDENGFKKRIVSFICLNCFKTIDISLRLPVLEYLSWNDSDSLAILNIQDDDFLLTEKKKKPNREFSAESLQEICNEILEIAREDCRIDPLIYEKIATCLFGEEQYEAALPFFVLAKNKLMTLRCYVKILYPSHGLMPVDKVPLSLTIDNLMGLISGVSALEISLNLYFYYKVNNLFSEYSRNTVFNEEIMCLNKIVEEIKTIFYKEVSENGLINIGTVFEQLQTRYKNNNVDEIINDIFNDLLQSKSNVSNKSCLEKIILSGDTKSINWLLKKINCSLIEINANADTALHLAVQSKNIHAVEILVNYFVDTKVAINLSNKQEKTPLHLAVESQAWDMVLFLLVKLKEANIAFDKVLIKNIVFSIVKDAPENSDKIKIVGFLKNEIQENNEENPSIANSKETPTGYTPLQLAWLHENFTIAKMLMENDERQLLVLFKNDSNFLFDFVPKIHLLSDKNILSKKTMLAIYTLLDQAILKQKSVLMSDKVFSLQTIQHCLQIAEYLYENKRYEEALYFLVLAPCNKKTKQMRLTIYQQIMQASDARLTYSPRLTNDYLKALFGESSSNQAISLSPHLSKLFYVLADNGIFALLAHAKYYNENTKDIQREIAAFFKDMLYYYSNALVTAVCKSKLTKVKKMLLIGKDKSYLPEEFNLKKLIGPVSGNSLLHIAAQTGNVAIIECLVQETPLLLTQLNNNNLLPLHTALEHNHIKATKYLLDAMMKFSMLDKNYYIQALSIAIDKQYSAMVSLLVAHVQNSPHLSVLEQRYILMVVLRRAIEGQHFEITQQLLDLVPFAILLKDEEKNTLLHYACNQTQEKIVMVVMQKGANLNVRNNNNATPLQIALANSKVNILDALLQTAKKEKLLPALLYKDNAGETLFSVAIKKNDYATAKKLLVALLLCIKENPNSYGKECAQQLTEILQLCVKKGQLELIKLLLTNTESDKNLYALNRIELVQTAIQQEENQTVSFLLDKFKPDLSLQSLTQLTAASSSDQMRKLLAKETLVSIKKFMLTTHWQVYGTGKHYADKKLPSTAKHILDIIDNISDASAIEKLVQINTELSKSVVKKSKWSVGFFRLRTKSTQQNYELLASQLNLISRTER